MTKLFALPNEKEQKKRVAIRMPKDMHHAIVKVLAEEGKSLRELSSWVSGAIVKLFNTENYWDIVAEEWLDKGENISRPMSLNLEAAKALEKMNATYRCRYQASPEINSKIIRTAITQRLIEEETYNMLT